MKGKKEFSLSGLRDLLWVLLLMAIFSCSGLLEDTANPADPYFNPKLTWLSGGQEIEPEGVDSLRFTISDAERIFYRTQTRAYEDRSVYFADLPRNIELEILIQGLDSLGAILFEGRVVFDGRQSHGTLNIDLQRHRPPPPVINSVLKKGQNIFQIIWRPNTVHFDAFELVTIDTIDGLPGANPEWDFLRDTLVLPSHEVTLQFNQTLQFKVRTLTEAGPSLYSDLVLIQGEDSGSIQITVLSHSNPDTLSSRITNLYGLAKSSRGIESLSMNGSPLNVIDGYWQVPGILLEKGKNQFAIEVVDKAIKPKKATLRQTIVYDPNYQGASNRPPNFLTTPGNLAETLKSGQIYQKVLKAADPDSFNVLVIEAGPPLELVEDTLLTWSPTLSDTGVNVLWAVVTDQDGARDSISWEVTVLDSRINTPPIIYSTPKDLAKEVIAGQDYDVQIIAVDLDDGIGLNFSMVQGDLPIDSATGRIIWKTSIEDLGVHSVGVLVEDDSGSVSEIYWTFKVIHPNVVEFSAGENLTVSINDTLYLRPIIQLTAGEVTKYEWALGDSFNFVEFADPVTQALAPSEPTPEFICRLRITLSDGNVLIDDFKVNILLDPPRIFFGEDVFILEGETKEVTGFALDQYGTIEMWEWKIGDGNWGLGDTSVSVSMPIGSPSLPCSLRVTDDDGLTTLGGTIAYSINMKEIVGGTFTMGSEVNEKGDETSHAVGLSSFKIDVYEITQKEYENRMGINPAGFEFNDFYPVESVTWYDAVLFCNARSKSYGFDTVYSYTSVEGEIRSGVTFLHGLTADFAVDGFRLPTEAEWEFAVRAGSSEEYFWGAEGEEAENYAIFADNSGSNIRIGGSLEPNDFGLYDMMGNVGEWCHDWYSDYNLANTENPRGPESGLVKSMRGGSWKDSPEVLRSAHRGIGSPGWKSKFVGFRTVLPLD